MAGRLRLISGMILFVFVLGHLINHALGIISLQAMSDALKYTIGPWRTAPGTIILVGALVIHAALASWALYQRRSLKMKTGELVQIALGFLIPILLAEHIIGTRGIYEAYGIEEGYAFFLFIQFVAAPTIGATAVLALFVVWFHACLGWHYWLRLKPWYRAVRIYLFSLALLLPALALAGVLSAVLRVMRLSRSESWLANLMKPVDGRFEEIQSFIDRGETSIQMMALSVVFVILLIHVFRWAVSSMPGGEVMNYRDIQHTQNRELKLQRGASVLDMLRQSDIPHASVCGGKGRCSTCRVRVDVGLEELESAGPEELRVLERVGAAPNVRLACQIKPKSALSVTAILDPHADASEGFSRQRSDQGQEQDIAILFADIRAFTKLSESQLPYDTAFLLNRYFAAMGQAIEGAGGHLDKFIGDGVMALFGIDKSMEQGCQEALRAAHAMSKRLAALNDTLQNDLNEPLRIGIGIHCGTAIVGKMGYNRAKGLTAIGDVVNTASRIEGLSKDFAAQLVVSQKTADNSGFDLGSFPTHQVEIRGRNEPMSVRVVKDASQLTFTN
ncbi:MAG: adenylate/guanylate cyclase domain-containing protein [Pseudomonadota bacterium]